MLSEFLFGIVFAFLIFKVLAYYNLGLAVHLIQTSSSTQKGIDCSQSTTSNRRSILLNATATTTITSDPFSSATAITKVDSSNGIRIVEAKVEEETKEKPPEYNQPRVETPSERNEEPTPSIKEVVVDEITSGPVVDSQPEPKSEPSQNHEVIIPQPPVAPSYSKALVRKESSSRALVKLANQKPSKELITGWLKLRSKVTVGGKGKWKKRFFSLRDSGWLSYYKDDKMRSDQCYGWIKLRGCTVSQIIKKKAVKDSKDTTKMEEEFKIGIDSKINKRIVYRHGPDPQMPPCRRARTWYKPKKCRLKCDSPEELRKWLNHLTDVVNRLDNDDINLIDSSDHDGGVVDEVSDDDDRISSSEDHLEPKGNDKMSVVPADQSTNSLTNSRQSTNLLTTSQSGTTAMTTSSSSNKPLSLGSGSSSVVPSIRRSNKRQSLTTSLLAGPNFLLNTADRRSRDMSVDEEELLQDPENRKGLLKELTKAASGLDITKITIPVSLNEPLSFLQRACELVAYSDLLTKADQCEDPAQRMMYVAAFAITQYCTERTTKPFNPLLGETFEYTDGGIRFVAEQVSHHPPIAVSHTESENFMFYQDLCPKTRFAGNSISCDVLGYHHTILKTSGEYYSWGGAKTVVHNVILGRLWLDHFGDMEIVNHTTGAKAKIEMKECGWFSKGRFEVNAWIYDPAGKTCITLKGKRNESLSATVIQGEPLESPIVWTNNLLQAEQNDPWKLNKFAKDLNVITEEMNHTLPESDSRFRPDRLALEKKDMKRASAEKRLLEERQREQAKLRKQKNLTWQPKYFECVDDNGYGTPFWKYKGNYWTERENKITNLSSIPKESSSTA